MRSWIELLDCLHLDLGKIPPLGHLFAVVKFKLGWRAVDGWVRAMILRRAFKFLLYTSGLKSVL